mmetsp:Transcript_41122/g.70387  ORF Transcript_41122/g.70387 Transcript_41122/m.70387 type:complete len:224 (+) Transcript_41122:168-839(+)
MLCQTMNRSTSLGSTETEDEIAAIEQSARADFGSPRMNDINTSLNHKRASGNLVALPASKQSSMGSVDTFNSSDFEKGELLLNFPNRAVSSSSSSKAKGGRDGGLAASFSSFGRAQQRNSISLNPIDLRASLAGLTLDLSDDEDDNNSSITNNNNITMKRQEEPSPPPLSNPKASGGPDHRPLVGGFAAAAYEAARVDYYKKHGMDVRGHNAPKPRSHYPRYP